MNKGLHFLDKKRDFVFYAGYLQNKGLFWSDHDVFKGKKRNTGHIGVNPPAYACEPIPEWCSACNNDPSCRSRWMSIPAYTFL